MMEIFNKPKNICDTCEFYQMIDSGDGYCRRFPPQHLKKCADEYTTKFFGLLRKAYYEYEYPVVAWCNFACGEYKVKKKRKK